MKENLQQNKINLMLNASTSNNINKTMKIRSSTCRTSLNYNWTYRCYGSEQFPSLNP